MKLGRMGARLLAGTCYWAFLAMPANAVVLNDQLASDMGGYSNYYDRDEIYANVGFLNFPASRGACTGSLIAPRVMLTAAHCVMNEDGRLVASPSTTIEFSPDGLNPNDGYSYASGVIAHAGYDHLNLTNDIALVTMQYGAWNKTPVQLAGKNSVLPAIGSRVKFVGFGATGTGSTPPSYDGPYDYKRRMGETTIYGYLAGDLSEDDSQQKFIIGEFADPALSDHDLPYLQAGAAPVDSGGPLFMETANGLVQIGIASWASGVSDDNLFGYGALNGWTNVTHYLDWIHANDPTRYVVANEGNYDWSNLNAWQDIEGRTREVPDNRDGNFDGFGATGRYFNVFLDHPGRVNVDMDAVIDNLIISNGGAHLVLPDNHAMLVWHATEVEAGSLTLNGLIDTSYIVMYGGTLSGSGTILTYDGVYNLAALLQPGSQSAPGTLTIAGNYAQWRDGALAITIADGAASRLDVSGVAQLDGRLAIGGRGLTPGAQFTILSADSVEGQFAATLDPFAFLDVSPDYQPQQVTISINRNGLDFADATTTPNARAAAKAAALLPVSHPVHSTLLQLADSQTQPAFASLAGEIYASSRAALLNNGRYMRDAVNDRIGQAFSGSLTRVQGPQASRIGNSELTLWQQGFASEGDYRSRSYGALDSRNAGLAFGADMPMGDWLFGLSGSYSQTQLSATGNQFSSDNYALGLYGGRQNGPFALKLGAIASWHDQSVSRQLAFGGLEDQPDSDFNGHSLQAFGEFSYSHPIGDWSMQPFAGLAFTHLAGVNGRENASAAALSYQLGAMQSLISTLGLRSERHIVLSDSMAFDLSGSLAWQHGAGDRAGEADMRLREGSDFSIHGLPLARDALLLETRIGFAIADGAQFGLSFAGHYAERSRDQMFKADLSWKF